MQAELQNAYQKGIRWSMLGSLVAAFFQFAQMAVFARLAGPEAAGEYALAATFISFLLPVAEAGLSQAVVQAAQIHPRQLALLAWINWVLGLFIFLVLWLLGPTLAGWFEQPELPGLLLLMGFSLLITPFGAQYAGLIARDLQFGQSAKIEISSWVLSFIGTVWLAFLGWDAWAMAAGFLLRNMAGTLGCVWYGQKKMPIHLFKISSLKEIHPMLRFGAFELSSRWADFFSNYLDKLIIAKWLGATALGYYNLAFTFLMLPTARLGYVITRVSFPIYARIQTEKAQLQAFFERSAQEIILLLYPIYLGMMVFSREIILICFGAKWLPAAPLFVILGLAGLVRTLCTPFPQMIKGLGKPQFWLVWMLIFSAVLCLFLGLFLWQNPGIESAAWSRTAAKFLVEIWMLWILAKWCGLSFNSVLKFAGSLAFYLLPLGLLTWLAGFASHAFWITTALKSMVFGIGLVLIYWFSPLSGKVRTLFQNFIQTKKQI